MIKALVGKEKAMISMLVVAAAAMLQDNRPPANVLDPPAGATAADQRTLSQPHRNMDPRMFPDLAVRSLRLDGDRLYVLVVNDGGARSRGSIRVAAEAMANGVRIASAARGPGLRAGESRWFKLDGFAAQSAGAARAPVFALEDASHIAASVVEVPATARTLDRSGQACDPAQGCGGEQNLANNGLRAEGRAIVRGRP